MVSDDEFLEHYDPTDFDRPTVAVDVVVVTVVDGELRVLLTRRTEPPFDAMWALPGVIVGMDEPLDSAAERALQTKGGLAGTFLEQLFTFGAPQRDPRTRVISIAYYALVAPERLAAAAADTEGRLLASVRVPWAGEEVGPVEALDERGDALLLAFDHAEIIGATVRRLRGKLDYSNIGFELLPRRFSLRELQSVHETILGQTLNKDSFRRRIVQSGRVKATGQRETDRPYRPAELYEFVRRSRKVKS